MSQEAENIFQDQIIWIHGGFSKEEEVLIGKPHFQFFMDFNIVRRFFKREIPNLLWNPQSAENIHLLDMPNRYAAEYDVWKEYFEQFVDNIQWNFTLIGHSLGSTFLIKYLTQESTLAHRITQAYLVAWVYRPIDPKDFMNIRTFTPKLQADFQGDFPIHVIHGDSDMDVSFENFEKFQAAYPSEQNPRIKFFRVQGAGHYLWTRSSARISEIIKK